MNLSGRGDKDTRTVAALDAAARAARGAGVIADRRPSRPAVFARARGRAARGADPLSRRRRSRTPRRRAAVIDCDLAVRRSRSSSASRTAIRSPTARRSPPPRSARSPRGMTLDGALALARGAHERGNAPILFFTYVNPIVQYGARALRRERPRGRRARRDRPRRAARRDWRRSRRRSTPQGLAIPLLVAPTTPPDRADAIAAAERRLRLHRLAARRHRAPGASRTSPGSRSRGRRGCARRRTRRWRSDSASRRRRTSPRSARSPTA